MMMLRTLLRDSQSKERYVAIIARNGAKMPRCAERWCLIRAEHSQPTPAFMMLVRHKVITALNITR
jgi:hypothetical protein